MAIKGKKTRAQLLAERRRIRDDLGSGRDVMRLPKVVGLVFRWVNDEDRAGVNRIENFKRRGWEVYEGEHVEVETPNKVTDANVSEGLGATLVVGTDRSGLPTRAVLMCISEELYQIDQQLKEESLLAREEGIAAEPNSPGMYGGIKIGNI